MSFFLTLRLKRDRTPHVANAPAAVSDAASKRALIVEDQSYNQIVMRRMAEKLGFAVDTASNASEALAHIEAHTYAVILLDWELPETTGEEIARRIRADLKNRAAILLATTAHDSEDIRRRCVVAGFDDFALKPISEAAIERQIEDLRRRRRTTDGKHQPALDTRVFNLVGRGRADGSRQAADDYARTLDQELVALQEAVGRDDRPLIARIAHRLKTHAGLVGASDLLDAVAGLERGAPTMTRATLLSVVSEISTHAANLREQLNRLNPPAATA